MRPDDIPQDVWDAAERIQAQTKYDEAVHNHAPVEELWAAAVHDCELYARAILAERERCARFVEIFPTRGSTPEMAEHAASEARSIAAAIRKGGE